MSLLQKGARRIRKWLVFRELGVAVFFRGRSQVCRPCFGWFLWTGWCFGVCRPCFGWVLWTGVVFWCGLSMLGR